MKKFGALLTVSLGFFFSSGAQACATCGQNFAFTPKLLLISTGFFFLPLALVGWVAWQLYQDQKQEDQSKKSS